MRRNFLILIFTVLNIFSLWAQTPAPRYLYPVKGVKRQCAANFGEIRPAHFHAGVDLKTDGVEGKTLVATADGYISRLVVDTYGYGKGLYLTLDDGTTVVYGHLQRFRKDLEELVQKERKAMKSNTFDRSFPPTRWRVRQGDVVGYSGNSGSSMGPHLHFEMRQAKTGKRLNLIKQGIIQPQDTMAPRILKLHYVAFDSINGVCMRQAPRTYAVLRYADEGYRLRADEPIKVGRQGYFILEASDRQNGVHNTFGVWRVRASLDGKPYFCYQMDGFVAAESRFCDAVGSYSLKLKNRNEVVRLAQHERAPRHFYPIMEDRGIVRCEKGDEHLVRIDVEDDGGNVSHLEFRIEGDGSSFCPAVDSTALLLQTGRPYNLEVGDWASAVLPSDALYEPIYTHLKTLPRPKTQQRGVVVLSDAVEFVDERQPLFRAPIYRLEKPVAEDLAKHTVMARCRRDGKIVYVGGRYRNGGVELMHRSGGAMLLVADTEAPSIRSTYRNQIPDLRRSTRLVFRVGDNFSGVGSIRMMIDDEWVAVDRYPNKGLVFHRFEQGVTGKRHRVRLEVWDHAGNKQVWTSQFLR